MKITKCSVSFDGHDYKITMHYFDGGKSVETFGHMESARQYLRHYGMKDGIKLITAAIAVHKNRGMPSNAGN